MALFKTGDYIYSPQERWYRKILGELSDAYLALNPLERPQVKRTIGKEWTESAYILIGSSEDEFKLHLLKRELDNV